MNNKERLKQMMKDCQDKESPKISLVIPTHRKSPDNKKDKILFKNLLQDIKVALENNYDRTDYEKALSNLEQLQEETMFWAYTTKGLVVLACDDVLETFKLNYRVNEKISVSDAFHIQPMFVYHEVFGKNYLVDLAKDRFKLFRIQENTIQEMTDVEIKTSFSQLYDDFDEDANVNVANYGGLSGMYHGHREKSQETKKDREKYFRYLDREFKQLHQKEDSDFIFSGTKENIAIFKKIAPDADYYHELAIEQPIVSMDHKEIEKALSDILQPLYDDALKELERDIRKADQDGKAIYDFDKIKEVAEQGRIQKIVVKEKPTLAVNIPLDEVINQVVQYQGDLIVLEEDSIDLDHEVIAIIR